MAKAGRAEQAMEIYRDGTGSLQVGAAAANTGQRGKTSNGYIKAFPVKERGEEERGTR